MKPTTLLASLLLASAAAAYNVTILDKEQGLSVAEYDESEDSPFKLPLINDLSASSQPLPLSLPLSAGETRSLSRSNKVARHHELAARMQAQESSTEEHSLEKRYKIYSGGQGTFYWGQQMTNPACNVPTPKDTDMVVAVPKSSPAKCGDTVHLHYGGKMVAATVVDYCGGCANALSVDMSKGAFKKLAPLDKGRLFNLHMRVVPK